MCRLFFAASIFLSTTGFITLVAGDQDEFVLLQAAVKARSPQTEAASEHVLACSDDEAPLDFSAPVDFSLVRNPEPLDAPSARDGLVQAHAKSFKAGPDPASVLFVRQVLWLLSAVLAGNGMMRWRGKDETSSECAPAEAEPALAAQHHQLHKAALAGDEARCEQLLGEAGILYRGGPCEALIATDSWGTTALHAAAICGAHIVAELFLEHGAPVDPVNASDETPLHMAARGGHMEFCLLLVKSGASLHAVNWENETPLLLASQAGHESICQALLTLGAGAERLAREASESS